MGFNLKSKLFVGNIYQQFESICQNVDGFINKDAMKLVEDQVQNVGDTAIRLYSNVVQDIVRLPDGILKCEQQLSAVEQVGMQDHVSVTDISATSTSTDEKKLPKYQENAIESQTCQYLRADGNAIVQNSESNTGVEKTTKDLKSVTANSSSDSEILYRKLDEDYVSSPVFSSQEEISTSIVKERRDFNTSKLDEGFSNDTMCLSGTSTTGWLSRDMLSNSEDPFSDVNGSLSNPSEPVSTHKVNENDCPVIDSPLPSVCDVNDWTSEKDRVLSESCDTNHEGVDLSVSDKLSEVVLSYHSCNNKGGVAIIPSTYGTSPKSSTTTESTQADFYKKAENILQSCCVSDGCTRSISAASSINAADTTKEDISADFSKNAACNISAASSKNATKDVHPFCPLLESNDNSTLQAKRSESFIGSSERASHLNLEKSPSETENTHDDLWKSINLSENSNHDRSVVFSNVAGSYRRKNFRYYKNLIKDAITSRKRLTTEYKQLAIMYGDLDFEPSSVSSFPNTTLHSSEEMKDQWELL